MELEEKAAGARVFNVLVNDEVVIPNLDVYREVG